MNWWEKNKRKLAFNVQHTPRYVISENLMEPKRDLNQRNRGKLAFKERKLTRTRRLNYRMNTGTEAPQDNYKEISYQCL